MKRKLLFILIIFLSLTGLGACTSISAKDYLRIHIRANSNAEIDQKIKYVVKEKIVEIITPIIEDLDTKNEVVRALQNSIEKLENETNILLEKNGFNYVSNIEIKEELFPTRYYGEYLLPSDYYDAIIVSLGTGSGDNWWCVVYPPLCFVESENQKVVYKSKLWEIIKKFFN